MKRHRFLLLALILLIAVAPGSALAQGKGVGGNAEDALPTIEPHSITEVLSDQIIVKFKENTGSTTRSNARSNEGLEKKKDLKLANAEVDKIKGQPIEQVINNLENRPEVEYAEPDYVVHATGYTDDTYFSQEWGLNNTGQAVNSGAKGTADMDINAKEASTMTQGDTNLVIAVIDDGVDFTHPDLKDRAWKNPGESGLDSSGKPKETNGIDDDGDGYVDDVNGWSFYDKKNTVTDAGGVGHGTHVSGTIAGSADGQGVVGVAPNVQIMALKFMGPSGSGSISDAIDAIGYAKSKGAKISNNSWGYSGSSSQALKDAIDASGMLFVAAAGNDGVDNDSTPHYPSSYDSPNVLSVAAIDNQGNLAGFSNYGTSSVDISAPGVDILSSVPGGSWEFWNGTSMATPHVTGSAALAASVYPALLNDPAKLKKLLTDSGRTDSATAGKTATGKMVNAEAAVSTASVTSSSDNAAPTGTVLINNGARSTTSRSSTLTLSASDNEGGTGVKAMRFSNDGTTWSDWEPYATTKTRWTLSSGSGTKTVYAEFRDGAGNVSGAAKDTIRKR